jgi:hypothetical protein
MDSFRQDQSSFNFALLLYNGQVPHTVVLHKDIFSERPSVFYRALTLTSPGCKYYISPLGLWPLCCQCPPSCDRRGDWNVSARVRHEWSALIGQDWGEGSVCWNYMLTEPGQDPSHLQFTNSVGLLPAPCGNILVTLSDFFWHFTKIRMQTVVFNRTGWVKYRLDIMLKDQLFFKICHRVNTKLK